jgi:acyl-coenzyme A thioesterase PaaI-like protein
VVQGGMLMTFADRALGRNAWKAAGDRPVATIQFGMQFISAGRIGEFFEIRPEVVRRTSSLVFMRGELVAGLRVVATAAGIWKILE